MTERTSLTRDLRVAIIGAGPGGMCMAVKLKDGGLRRLRHARAQRRRRRHLVPQPYPGCGVRHPVRAVLLLVRDQARLVTAVRDRSPRSSSTWRGVARKYGLLPHCRFGGRGRARRLAARHRRRGRSSSTRASASRPMSSSARSGCSTIWPGPTSRGWTRFAGTSFHSAQWNWDHDLTGESVAVIGSAASAVQFVPEIVKQAGQVHLFQRTANWVLPKLDDAATPRRTSTRLPRRPRARHPAADLRLRRQPA